MSVAFDAVSGGTVGGAGGTSLSFNHVLGSITNGFVAAAITVPTSATSLTCTINGNSASQITGAQPVDDLPSGGFGRGAIMYIFGLTTGSTTGTISIAFSWTGTVNPCGIGLSFGNVNQLTPYQNGGHVSTDFGSAAISSANFTPAGINSTSGNMTVDFVATAGSGAPSAPSQTAQGSARTVNATVNAGAIWCSTAAGSTTNTHSWTTATNGSYQGGFDLIAAATASTKLSITRFRANAFTHGRK